MSLVPLWCSAAGSVYAACAAVLGAIYLGCSISFLRHADETSARRLLRASLFYLPLLLALLLRRRGERVDVTATGYSGRIAACRAASSRETRPETQVQ